MARQYNIQNDPIAHGLSGLADALMKKKMLDAQNEENLRKYGPVEVSSGIINSLPEDMRTPYRDQQATIASDDEKRNAVLGSLSDDFFNSDAPKAAPVKFSNSLKVSRDEADILKEVFKERAKLKLKGNVTAAQLATQKGKELVPGGIAPDTLFDANPKDIFGDDKFDQRTIRPQFQAEVDKARNKEIRAIDIVPPDGYMTVAESSLYNKLLQNEQNAAMSGERKEKEETRKTEKERDIQIRKDAADALQEQRKTSNEFRKIVIGMDRERLNLSKTADPKELTKLNSSIAYINRLGDLANKSNNIETGYLPAGKAFVEGIRSNIDPNFKMSQNSEKMKELIAATSLENIKYVGMESGQSRSVAEMKRFEPFQIKGTESRQIREAKLKGLAAALKDDAMNRAKGMLPKTPIGVEGKPAEIESAIKNLEGAVSKPKINASQKRTLKSQAKEAISLHPDQEKFIKDSYKQKTGEDF